MLTCTSGLIGEVSSTKQNKPNVLFIMADDLGWRDTSVYGSTFYETPNIDALAKSGMMFSDAYAANPLCSPTRASILTGQYPMRTGFTYAMGHVSKTLEHKQKSEGPEEIRASGPSTLNYLDPKYYTLGKAMKDAGYATGFFGKWHMGSKKKYWPENHGFDHVKGGRQHSGPPGINSKRKFYPPWNCDTLKPYPSKDTHVDDYITDLTIDYIAEQKKNKKPFFACYWAYSVHAPFQSKPELIEKWKKKVDPKNPQHSPTMAAMIEVFDTNVGRLMKALKDNGLDNNTIVIFTSDNGGNMYNTVDGTTPTNNYPLRSGKGNNYEGGVRVPLIVRWPGVTTSNSICESVVSTVDHFPAILEMTGQKLRPKDHKDGVSYVPALQGNKFDRGFTFCDMPHPVWATYNIPNTFVRKGDWKLYRFWYDSSTPDTVEPTHRYELYNVKEDISDSKNLAGSKPDQVKLMTDALDAYYRDTGVLSYSPNKNYNKRTVGTWYATTEDGTISGKDETLFLKSDKPDYAVKNRFFPKVDQSGFLIFEARSSTNTSLELAGRGKGRVLPLTNKWTNYELSGKDIFIDRKKFLISLKSPGTIELRNVRVVAEDKTEMMRYSFY